MKFITFKSTDKLMKYFNPRIMQIAGVTLTTCFLLVAWLIPEIQLRRFDFSLFWNWLFSVNSLLSFMMVLSICILIYIITGKYFFSTYFAFLMLLLLSIAESMKCRFLVCPINFYDLYFFHPDMFPSFLTVIYQYSGARLLLFVFAGAFAIITLFLVWVYPWQKQFNTKKRLWLLILIAILITPVIINGNRQWKALSKMPFGNRLRLELLNEGIVFSLFNNLTRTLDDNADGPVIGWSNSQRTMASKIKETQKVTDLNTSSPDIILIIWESFFDIRHLPDLVIHKDMFLPEFSKYFIQQKHRWVSPTFGGTSCNPDLEIYTGIPTLFFRAESNPLFEKVAFRRIHSSIDDFNSLGYNTIMFSAEKTTFFRNKYIYQNLGFNKVYGPENYSDAIYQESWPDWVDDKTLFLNAMKVIKKEQNENKPFFAVIRTDQCHGPYNKNVNQIEMQHSKFSQDNLRTLGNYAAEMNNTDALLGQLVNQFQASPRKTIIFVVADHLPSFAEFFDKSGYSAGNDWTSYTIESGWWSNYDIPAETKDLNREKLLGLYNFGVHIFEISGLPLSEYLKEVKTVSKDFPIVSHNGITDDDGKRILRKDFLASHIRWFSLAQERFLDSSEKPLPNR